MDAFLHQLFSGLTIGSVYACIALALVMIFQSTHVVNFAQGEMAMFSTYLAWLLIALGFSYLAAFALTVLASFVLGGAIERIVIRPLAKAPMISIVIVMIGLFVILNSVAGLLFNYEVKSFPAPPVFDGYGNAYISSQELGIVALTLVVLALVYGFFRYSSLGLAMRAAAQNPASSELVGIRVGRMLSIGWGLAAAIGAVAGMLAAPIVFLDPNMMSGILLYGFAGALLGGITNPWGAAAGGFIVGVLENLAGAYLVGTQLKLTVALVIIMVIVTLKPTGLFGRTVVTRV